MSDEPKSGPEFKLDQILTEIEYLKKSHNELKDAILGEGRLRDRVLKLEGRNILIVAPVYLAIILGCVRMFWS